MARDVSRPRSSTEGAPYTLYRVTGTRIQPFTVLSRAWIGIESHFVGGQSVICPPQGECEICQRRKALPRWRGYLMAEQKWGRKTIVCLEFTARAADSIMRRYDDFGSLRGHQLNARRLKDQKNAAMEVTWERDVLSEGYLASVHPLSQILAAVYKVHPAVLAPGDVELASGDEDVIDLARILGQKMSE